LGTEIAQDRASLAAQQNQLKNLAESRRRQKRLLSLNKQLAGLEKNEPKKPVRPQDYDKWSTWSEEIRKWQDSVERAESILATLYLYGVVECPTCGTLIEDLGKLRELADSEMPEDLFHKGGFIGDFEQYDMDKARYDRKIAAWTAKRDQVNDEIAQFGGFVPVEVDEDELNDVITSYDASCSDLEEVQSAVTKTTAAVAKWGERKKNAAALLAESDAAIAEKKVSTANFKKAETALAEDHLAEVELGKVKGQLEEVETRIEDYAARIAKVQVAIEKSKAARKWIKHLEKIRENLHRDGLPTTVAQAYLRLLEDEINETLHAFDDPFYVEADDSLTFNVFFPDGREMPAQRLSGGEKVVLALAFRLAVYSLFTDNIGLMVLDEPTSGLDERNMENLERALQNLNELCKTQGLQIVMITHEKQLAHVFDEVLNC